MKGKQWSNLLIVLLVGGILYLVWKMNQAEPTPLQQAEPEEVVEEEVVVEETVQPAPLKKCSKYSNYESMYTGKTPCGMKGSCGCWKYDTSLDSNTCGPQKVPDMPYVSYE